VQLSISSNSIHRQLRAAAMRCPTDPDHLGTVSCDTCGEPFCQACGAAYPGHGKRPYHHVDWNARPPRRLVNELGELMGDVAKALQAGLDEVMPRMLRG
jgi:hypothetical protein